MSKFNQELLPYVGQDLWVKISMPYTDYRGKVSIELAYLNIISVDENTEDVDYMLMMAWIIDDLIRDNCTEYYNDICEALDRVECANIAEFNDYTVYQPVELYTTNDLYDILDNCKIIRDDYDDDDDYFL